MDIKTEELLTFSEAAAFLPRRPNLSTLHRWRLKGVRGVRLETCLVGGRRFTSKEAIARFSEATTAVADGRLLTTVAANRQKAIEAAERELDAAGI